MIRFLSVLSLAEILPQFNCEQNDPRGEKDIAKQSKFPLKYPENPADFLDALYFGVMPRNVLAVAFVADSVDPAPDVSCDE